MVSLLHAGQDVQLQAIHCPDAHAATACMTLPLLQARCQMLQHAVESHEAVAAASLQHCDPAGCMRWLRGLTADFRLLPAASHLTQLGNLLVKGIELLLDLVQLKTSCSSQMMYRSSRQFSSREVVAEPAGLIAALHIQPASHTPYLCASQHPAEPPCPPASHQHIAAFGTP